MKYNWGNLYMSFLRLISPMSTTMVMPTTTVLPTLTVCVQISLLYKVFMDYVSISNSMGKGKERLSLQSVKELIDKC